MEFLTLQDVPRYHRSAMPIGERSPTRHQVKQHETAERMKVGSIVHHDPLFPSSPSESYFPPMSPSSHYRRPSQRHSFQRTPSPAWGRQDRTMPPRQVYPDTRRQRRTASPGDREGMDACWRADEWRERRERHELWRRRAMRERQQSENSTIPEADVRQYPLARWPPNANLWQMPLPRSEMLTAPEIHSQTNNNAQLPSFKELLDSTNGSPGNPSNQLKSAPTTMDYYQTPSARASRQSSAEGPVFNDPFRGAPPPNLPLRNVRPPTENYTTQLEGRPSLLQARPSTNYDSRRTSVRTEYEPRIPSEPRIHSLPSLFNPSRNSPPEPASITTASQVYHPQNAYVQPIPDIRRTSEVPYAHQAYYNEHYTSRPPFASEYTRPAVRHDSTVFGMPPPPPYVYSAGFAYGADHQNGMEGYTSNRRRRGNLPKEATATLKKWFADHAESPYPTDEEKNALAVSTGLSSAQISNWFINARRRNPGKEARESARHKLSEQQQVQRTNGTQEQSLGVQQATTSPLQQPNHALQPHHEQHYPLPQIQPPPAYYDREMSDA